MMSKSDKARLGVFLLITGVLILGVLAAFAGLKIWDTGDSYVLYSRDTVNGLNVGSQVKLRGVLVGTVREMQIDPENIERIKIDVSLKDGTPIMQDTRAVIASQGLTGLRYIDLNGGSAGSKRLEPGQEILTEPGLIGKLSNRAEDITDHTDQMILEISKVASTENRQRVERILAKSESLVEHTDQMVVELTKTLIVSREFIQNNEASIGQTLRNAQRASAQLPALVADGRRVMGRADDTLNNPAINELLTGLVLTNTSMRTRIDQIDVNSITGAVNNLQMLIVKLIGSLGQNQEQVRAMVFNMRRTSDNIKMLSQDLKEKPSKLLFSDDPEPRKLP